MLHKKRNLAIALSLVATVTLTSYLSDAYALEPEIDVAALSVKAKAQAKATLIETLSAEDKALAAKQREEAKQREAERQAKLDAQVKEQTAKTEAVVGKAESLKTNTETLSTEAESLNSEIQKQIDQIRLDRRLELERVEKNYQDFLTSSLKHKFVNYNARTETNLTGPQLEKALVGTGLEGLGQFYADAEEQYKVSAIILIGLSAHESAWGTSRFAVERNNLFGYQAYDHDTNKAKVFESKEEAIHVVANHLATNYLTEGAKYHNGNTLRGMNVRYASDKGWNYKITKTMNRIVEKMASAE